MEIYFAGAYARREELLAYKHELEDIRWLDDRGQSTHHHVTSRWLLGLHEAQEGDWSRWREFAKDDLDDICRADWMFLFTEPSVPDLTTSGHQHWYPASEVNRQKRGGRHTEFGYAMARGMQLVIVGPRENVFHHNPTVMQVDTWRDLYDSIVTVWTPQEATIGNS